MFPPLTPDHAGDSSMIYAKFFGQGTVASALARLTAIHVPNVFNLGVRQFSVRRLFAEDLLTVGDTVCSMLLFGKVLKIGRMVVPAVCVLMVYLRTLRAWAKKRQRYEGVNTRNSLFSVSTECHPKIVTFLARKTGLKNSREVSTSRWAVDGGQITAHSPQIRHRVNTFIANHVAPFFCGEFLGRVFGDEINKHGQKYSTYSNTATAQ